VVVWARNGPEPEPQTAPRHAHQTPRPASQPGNWPMPPDSRPLCPLLVDAHTSHHGAHAWWRRWVSWGEDVGRIHNMGYEWCTPCTQPRWSHDLLFVGPLSARVRCEHPCAANTRRSDRISLVFHCSQDKGFAVSSRTASQS